MNIRFIRGRPGLNWGHFDLQLNALPLSYYPINVCMSLPSTFWIIRYSFCEKNPYLLIFVSHRMRKQRIIWLIIEFLLNRRPRQIFQLFKWRNCVLLNKTSWTALTQISFHKLMRISFKLSKFRLIRRNIFSELIFKFNKHNNEII